MTAPRCRVAVKRCRDFRFPLTRRALPRIDRLRLALGLDLWPAAAFVVLSTAAEAGASNVSGLALPPEIRARAARNHPPASGGVFGQRLLVRQARPDPLVVDFLHSLGACHNLPPARAALALVMWWAECGAAAWEGAPDA